MKILIEPNKISELNNLDEELTIKKQKDLAQIYSRTFNGKDGIMIIEDLAEASGMYRTNFIPDNDRYTAFLEGKRALFLYICYKLENNIEENKVINYE